MMEKIGRIALLSLIITHLSFVQSSRYEGSTDCDFVRSSYVQLEKTLWERYVDKNSLSLARHEILYKIFNMHNIFIGQHFNSGYDDKDFSVLEKFYEWKIIEPDVKSIHALFKDHFLQRLETELETNNADFDERACLDLAETVLTDPLWPVNGTIEKIQTNIYNQGLYYKAKSVGKTFNLRIEKSNKRRARQTTLIQLFALTHSRKRQSRYVLHKDRPSRFFTSSTMR